MQRQRNHGQNISNEADHMLRLRIAAFLLISSACAGRTSPDCIDETRAFSAQGRFTNANSPADTGRSSLGLYEARNHRTKVTTAREITWDVRAPNVVRAHVTAIHVHAGEGDPTFIQIPIDTINSPSALTTTHVRRQFPGIAASWPLFYEAVGSGNAYLDIHVGGSQPRVLRADLGLSDAVGVSDWRAFQHTFCS
jgi:hypothetical protein